MEASPPAPEKDADGGGPRGVLAPPPSLRAVTRADRAGAPSEEAGGRAIGGMSPAANRCQCLACVGYGIAWSCQRLSRPSTSAEATSSCEQIHHDH